MDSGVVQRLTQRAAQEGFDASSTTQVGELLETLAASKPGGSVLELGTGVGLGTGFLLSGMSSSATLVTVELDGALSRVAQEEITDARIEWVIADGAEWLSAQDPLERRYDLVFADTWPGKFHHLDQALALVAPGGLYVVDDLLPQPDWPASHRVSVDALVARLASEQGWHACRMDIGSGVMVCARSASAA